MLYSPDSPAGKGAKWEWAGDSACEWHTYDMEVQYIIEDAWAKVSGLFLKLCLTYCSAVSSQTRTAA